uniref:Protein kinase domain-containing protein n=1 Tax=Amphimedon queenslandica TaxID=400682 RepID=A0A1X7T034_AMPQE
HLKVTLVSWIAPIFIVIFCFSPNYMNYINNSSNFCRAFDTPFYIGMVIPFVIVYSFIWVMFIIVIISLLMSSRIKDSNNKKKVLKPSYKYQLATSLAHSTLFCLSSVLMLLMTEDTFTNTAIRDLVASLFVLLTGSHGLFLFVVHCLCTKEFYHICKKVSFGIKSLLLHAVEKKPSIDRNGTVKSTNQYLETKFNSNVCHNNFSSHLEQLLVKYSIPASQINLQEAVGQGEFGIVYRALLATGKDVPQVVAVKTLKEKSDIWSYGVLCWEVFNGGKTPFPGLDPAGVIELLDTGGRLNCPHNDACSDKIYELMLSCWLECPNDRPLFSELNT